MMCKASVTRYRVAIRRRMPGRLLLRRPSADHLPQQRAEDNGGVHLNSGIPNRAFHLAAARFGGHAWEKAARSR